MSEVDEKRAKFCAEFLGLEGDYEITYLANSSFPFLLDPSYVAEQIDFNDWPTPNADDIEMAVNEASTRVILPNNFRIIGLSNKNDRSARRIYGVVDVSGCD